MTGEPIQTASKVLQYVTQHIIHRLKSEIPIDLHCTLLTSNTN